MWPHKIWDHAGSFLTFLSAIILLILLVIPSATWAASVPPVLINPPNSATNVETADVVFSWQKSGDTTDYKLDLATDADFAHLILADFISDSKTEFRPGIKLNAATTYYWRVTAAMPEISTSLVFIFTTKSQTISSPQVAASSATTTPNNPVIPTTPANLSVPSSIAPPPSNQVQSNSSPNPVNTGKPVPIAQAPSASVQPSGQASVPAQSNVKQSSTNSNPDNVIKPLWTDKTLYMIGTLGIVAALISLFVIMLLKRRKAEANYAYESETEIQDAHSTSRFTSTSTNTKSVLRRRVVKDVTISNSQETGEDSNTLLCWYCGSANKTSSQSCKYCGANIDSSKMHSEILSEVSNQCPSCGIFVAKGQETCHSCGYPLSKMEDLFTCPACQSIVTRGNSTCPGCGVMITWD